jgi:hypothetical protein
MKEQGTEKRFFFCFKIILKKRKMKYSLCKNVFLLCDNDTGNWRRMFVFVKFGNVMFATLLYDCGVSIVFK